MEVESGVFDISRRPAVMVNDRHPVAGFQKLGIFHHVRTVGIHHYQKRVGPHLQKCLSRGKEHAAVLRQRVQPGDQGLGRGVLPVNDDPGLLSPFPGGAANTRGSAHGIHIRKGVAHDVDLSRVRDQLSESVGHHTGFHFGPLLRGLGAAAVEGEVHLIPHHRLIAAPAQCHFQRELGVFVQLRDAGRILADADGQGGVDILRHADRPDSVQNRKLFIHKMLEILFLKQKQIMIPVRFQQDPMARVGPGLQFFVDLRQDRAALGILAGLHQVLVVVQHQDRRHRAAGLVDLSQMIGLRSLHPVGGGHQALHAGAVPGAHQTAVDPETVIVQLHPLRAFLLSAQQPLDLKIRYSLGKPHLKEMLPDAGQLQKALIAPDDLSGVRPEHQRGQGRVDEGGLAGGVHTAGDRVDVLQNALPPLLIALPEIEVQQNGQRSLSQSQLPVDRDGCQGKQQHDHKIKF